LQIGGWSGSNTFSGLVATDTSRADFVATLDTALTDYGFDGVDADWEYPSRAGATEDFDTANDLKNYLEFFKTLRTKIGSDKLISSDTSSGPWVGADGSASTDLSEFGDVLDFITIMTYDAVTYSAAATGPNFALDSSCAPSTQQFSYPAAVKSWTAAKFPANKIMLGLASYGYAWKVRSALPFSLSLRPPTLVLARIMLPCETRAELDSLTLVLMGSSTCRSTTSRTAAASTARRRASTRRRVAP
ncbi:glycoside hydrolase family 18 protein, partial [Rhodotorula graminis WP1]